MKDRINKKSDLSHLVLSCNAGQSIYIDKNIKITLIGINKFSLRFHIENGDSPTIVTKEIGESFNINNNVFIDLWKLNNYQATLGIHAPRHMKVDREKIHKRKIGVKN